MALRSKSQMRLLILAAASAVVVGGAGGFIWYRRVQRHNFILTELPAGLQAYKDGETVKTLQLLGDYLRNIDSDNVEAIAAYADVRMALPERNNEQISDLTARYRRLIALKPADKEYKYKLLKVYSAGDMHAEADQLAEAMLKEDPNDVEARQRLTASLMGLKKWPEARASALKTLETDPLSTVAAQQVLTCMAAMQLPGAAMQSWGLDWLKGREGEPGELLFEAMVWDYAAVDNQGEIRDDMTAKAVDVLKRMIDEKPRSAEYVGYAVTIMDNVNQPALATKYLEKYRGLYNDIKLDERFYRRLAYAGQFERIEKELSDSARQSEKSTLLTALRFMALAEQKKFTEARPFLDVLKERGQRWDFGAEDWRQVLSMVYFDEAPLDHPGDKVVKLRLRDLLDTLMNACMRAPDEAFFQCFLGDAYAHSGDAGSAIARWEGTTKLAPSWARPWMQLATMAEAMKDPFTAMVQARQANFLQPNQSEIMVTLLRAWNAALSQNPLDLKTEGEDSPAKMLALLEQIRKQFPEQEAVVSLQVEIELKLHGDRQRAVDLVKGDMAAQPALSELTLLRLAVVCHDNALEDKKVPLDELCIAASEKAHGSSPQASWTRALFDKVKDYDGAKKVLLAAKNKGVEQAVGQKDADATILSWGIVWGRFLELGRDKEAPGAWREIAFAPGTKDLPENKQVLTDDTNVLWALVDTTSMWKDHEFMGRVLEKLRASNGESGLSWRLEKSRWLLDDKSRDSQKATMDLLSDTVKMWPKSAPVRELLAQAYENAGNLTSASAQRIIASELDVHNLGLKIDAAQTLLQQGEFARAQPLLETVLEEPWATDMQRLQAAVLLADVPQQGASETAMKALQSRAKSADKPLYLTDDTRAAALTVAVLYWRLGLAHPAPNNENLIHASAAFEELLKTPNPDIIEQASSYYLAISRADLAQKAIDQLDAIKIDDVRKHTIQGRFLLKNGKNKDAVIALRAAVNVIDSPPSPETWRWLMAALVTDNQIAGTDGVIAVAKGLKGEVKRVTDDWNKTKSDTAATPEQVAVKMNLADEMQLLAENPAVKACAADSPALEKMLSDEDGRNYMVSCFFSPLDAKSAQDVVLAFGGKEPQDITQGLKILAARSQDSLSLQIFAMRRLVIGNQIDEALHLAEQAEKDPSRIFDAGLLCQHLLYDSGAVGQGAGGGADGATDIGKRRVDDLDAGGADAGRDETGQGSAGFADRTPERRQNRPLLAELPRDVVRGGQFDGAGGAGEGGTRPALAAGAERSETGRRLGADRIGRSAAKGCGSVAETAGGSDASG